MVGIVRKLTDWLGGGRSDPPINTTHHGQPHVSLGRKSVDKRLRELHEQPKPKSKQPNLASRPAYTGNRPDASTSYRSVQEGPSMQHVNRPVVNDSRGEMVARRGRSFDSTTSGLTSYLPSLNTREEVLNEFENQKLKMSIAMEDAVKTARAGKHMSESAIRVSSNLSSYTELKTMASNTHVEVQRLIRKLSDCRYGFSRIEAGLGGVLKDDIEAGRRPQRSKPKSFLGLGKRGRGPNQDVERHDQVSEMALARHQLDVWDPIHTNMMERLNSAIAKWQRIEMELLNIESGLESGRSKIFLSRLKENWRTLEQLYSSYLEWSSP